ncbi:hypothetical protein RHMOL_Rhmol11G0023900 [Rhododendron molle]|uniref:Uncharacterized protein n=1 Tax=Rhododendron molle TaxID=49168 RepID=A0ACC0LNV9_RHOML|nr:hypothetical protein RHMOL_Rhmol11G0023900 [Rhododendron molle]
MEHEIGDQTTARTVEEHRTIEGEHRAIEGVPRATDQAGAVGSSSEPGNAGMVVEGPPMVERGSGGVEGSGAVGDDTELSQTPPRDSAKGKGVVTEEEHAEEVRIEEVQTTEVAPVEIRVEDIAFRPPAGAATSSRHVPITYADIAEHAPDELLAKLLEDHPVIGEYVLKAKEDRARAIEEAEAVARAGTERAGSEGLAADIEAEEREAEEAQGPRVSAVAETGAMKCLEFSEETYMLSRQHLFVPSGFAGYRPPQQTDYDLELVLKDPRVHIANTWAEAEQRDIHGFGGPCSSLALYIGLPARVRELVDAACFREFILRPQREKSARYAQFIRYLKKKPTNEHEEAQMARAYLLYMFGASLYPGRGSTVHLSYLPALRDLRTASRFDWGGAALGTAYLLFGDSSRTGQSTAGYWHVWELWAYEVLRMYPPECKHPDLSTLPRALIGSKEYRGTKEGRGSLNAYRLYLDELRASQV